MKKFIFVSILAAMVTTGMAQDYPDEYLGLPGDNLNLYAVMNLFQESETLEAFERDLNNENSRINNLDLNGDNLIDYINVIDYADGDVHTIVLRTSLTRNDIQDLAVFTVQKFRDGSVQIQLVGDEALYGKNYIIEPITDNVDGETPNPGYTGRRVNSVNVTVIRTTPFEIAAWPIVRFIYLPGYVSWRSSWYWDYYPTWWHPWRPYYWHYYYGYHYHWHSHYYAHFRHWNHNRFGHYNDFYYTRIRVHAPLVVVNINKGYYKNTYSHPEQRRDGEVLYTKLHGSSSDRRTAGTTASSQRRGEVSTGSRQATERSSANVSASSRRTVTEAGSKSGTTVRSSQENASVSRRNSPAVSSDRPSSRTTTSRNPGDTRSNSSMQKSGTSARSSASVSNRSSASVSNRSSASVNNRPSASVNNRPSASVNNRPSASVNNRPSSSVNNRPSSSVNNRPSASVNNRPSASVNRQSPSPGKSTPSVSARPASRSAQGQKSSTARAPSRSPGSTATRSKAPASKSSSGKSERPGTSDKNQKRR